MIKKASLFLFFVLALINLQGQNSFLHPLNSNATLINYHKNKAKQKPNSQLTNRTQSTLTVALSLPFYDEFSYPGPFPDSARWQNSQSAFVNQTKAMAPPTLGVATLDGLNKYGYPYNPAVATSQGNLPGVPADTLTSAPIRLDSISALQIGLSPADSVYLSFYYQGRGYWEKPEQSDILSLDMYSPSDSVWSQIWSIPGYLYNPDSTWHLVMLPITDTSYFHNGFQFRFRNLSGGSGDVDHWHLDAVYLNRKRSQQDTMFSAVAFAFNDISFVYDLQSPLKNYTQMPYNQYSGAIDMKDSIGVFLRSNFSTAQFVHTAYNFYNATNTVLNFTPNGSNNLSPFVTAGYCSDKAIIDPSLGGFAYPPSTSDNSFSMKFYLTPSLDNIPQNDTITFHQIFSNYYSYDDGSAEAGFGIGSPNGAGNYKTAARFTLNKADTLRAMDIFFEPVIDVDLIKTSPFDIVVWADNNGLPGNVIYTDTMRYPYFPADSAVNGVIERENSFLRYQLTTPVILNAGTTFYLGINQINVIPQINIGFDMNTDFHNNMFYNADGTDWYVFPGDQDPDYRGALMIHPVFGDSLQALSIEKIKLTNAGGINVYPNPASDEFFLQSDNAITKLIITDMLGNEVLQQTETSVQKINTLSLPGGAYLIKAFTNKGFCNTKKLIITR